MRVFSFLPTSNDLITSADILALILLLTREVSTLLENNNFTVEQFYSIYPVKSFVLLVNIKDNLHFLAAKGNLFCSHIKIAVDVNRTLINCQSDTAGVISDIAFQFHSHSKKCFV